MKLENFKIKKYTLLKLYLLKYQAYNKRILFIGFPYIKNKLVLKDSQHFFLQKKVWMPGLFSNNSGSSRKAFLPTKNFDLVVLFNASNTDIVLLKELSSLGFPLIVLGSQIPLDSINSIYTVPVFVLKKKMKQLCSFLIYSIIKKPKKRNKLRKLFPKKKPKNFHD